MKTKQRSFQGFSAYSSCIEFINAMRTLFDVRKIILEEVPIRNQDWVTQWRVIVKYE